MDTILNEVNPDEACIRRWAYDDDLYFMEQDEDLLLYGVDYFPIIIELSVDRKCPKRDYVLLIVYNFVHWNTRNGLKITGSNLASLSVEIEKYDDMELRVWFQSLEEEMLKLAHKNRMVSIEFEIPGGQLKLDFIRKLEKNLPGFKGRSSTEIYKLINKSRKIDFGIFPITSVKEYKLIAENTLCRIVVTELEI